MTASAALNWRWIGEEVGQEQGSTGNQKWVEYGFLALERQTRKLEGLCPQGLSII